MNTIGQRLKYLRDLKNLKLKDVKELIGIATGALSDLENDKKQPSTATIISLSRIYNASCDWILTGSEFISQMSDNNYRGDITNKEYHFLEQYRKLSAEDQLKIEGMVEMKLVDNETTYIRSPEHNEISANVLHETELKYNKRKKPKIEKRGSSHMVFGSTKITPSKSRMNA